MNRIKPFELVVTIVCDVLGVARILTIAGLSLLLGACALPYEKPESLDEGQMRERATSKTVDDIRVSAVIPSDDEISEIFGVDLSRNGIQPFWLEIENGTDRQFVLLPTGLDPEYFDPFEVAYLYEGLFTDDGHEALSEHIVSMSFDSRRRILPGETVSGFLYLYKSHSSLVATIDLLGQKWSKRISLLVPVSGYDEAQDRVRNLEQLYTAQDIVALRSESALRSALENLPCCSADKEGAHLGWPLNLVVIGEIEEVGPAFGRRLYRYSPVGPSFVFGREQDLSGRKFSRWVAPQPHTVKLWLTPLRFHEKPVWIGKVNTRLGGRFGEPAKDDGTIEPDVDEARNDLIQDLLYSQTVKQIGFVKGAKCADAGKALQKTIGEFCRTDGLRAVLVFGYEEVSLESIDIFDWERLVE